MVDETFAENLAAEGRLTADTSNSANSPSLALDRNLDKWRESDAGPMTAMLALKPSSAVVFDHVSSQEEVDWRVLYQPGAAQVAGNAARTEE
jgi:hypothetical protein